MKARDRGQRHVRRAQAGELVQTPFSQNQLNTLLHSMLIAKNKQKWGAMGYKYISETDIYSRAKQAATIIEEVAR